MNLSATTSPRFANCPTINLKGEHTHIRPDGILGIEMAKLIQSSSPPKPIQITEIDADLKSADQKGWFHWFTFGRKLIEKINDKAPELLDTHDFIVSINRQSSYQPERNKVKSFKLIKRIPANSSLQREDFEKVDKSTIKSLAQHNGVKLKDALFTLFALPKES